MKRIIIFLGGLVCGAFLLLLIQYGIQKIDLKKDADVAIDEDTIISLLNQPIEIPENPFHSDAETSEPGELIREKSFKVVDVGDKFNALVCGKDEWGDYNGTVYLLKQSIFAPINHEMITFYDNQIIKVPKGKEVRMFGTYTYESRGAGIKTVPIIRIIDKQ